MIVALILAMIGWGCWLWLRDATSPQAMTPAITETSPVARTTTALGLEDDPVHWRDTHAWSALDERQLSRLLAESAPIDRPVTNSDNPVPRVEHKDTP